MKKIFLYSMLCTIFLSNLPAQHVEEQADVRKLYQWYLLKKEYDALKRRKEAPKKEYLNQEMREKSAQFARIRQENPESLPEDIRSHLGMR